MRSRLRATELPLVPTEIAGLVLVALAAVLLSAGFSVSSGAPADLGRWVLAAGLLLLLGAALATVVLGSSRRVSGPATSPKDRRSPSTQPAPTVDAEPASGFEAGAGVFPSSAEGAVHGVHRSLTTSIPGAYLAAVESPPGPEAPEWVDPSPPIAAALPFAAMPRAPGVRVGTGEEGETSAVLEVELARLRARLREMETETTLRQLAAARLDVSGGSRGPLSAQPALDVGRPAWAPLSGGRACAGCGNAVGSTGTPSLCSSCGRLLCPTCAAEAGGANGLLYCPDCVSRREAPGSPSISGGRTAPPPTSASGDRPGAGSPPEGPG